MSGGLEYRGVCGGHPVWGATAEGVEVRFVGRGEAPRPELSAVLEAVEGAEAPEVAWVEQVHGARVVETVEGGRAGAADGVVTEREGLALSVVTADCVPVVLAGRGRVAAVHAGWRGIVAGVVAAAVERMGGGSELRAWMGPAVMACCYEVSREVAERLVAASGPGVVAGRSGRGRLLVDLQAAVGAQLEAAGVERGLVEGVAECTSCDGKRLWSYRRDGEGTGRSVGFVWRRG